MATKGSSSDINSDKHAENRRAARDAKKRRASKSKGMHEETYYFGKRADTNAETFQNASDFIAIALYGHGLTIGKEIVQYYHENPGYDRIERAVTTVLAKHTTITDGLRKLVMYKTTKVLQYAERVANRKMQLETAENLLRTHSRTKSNTERQLTSV